MDMCLLIIFKHLITVIIKDKNIYIGGRGDDYKVENGIIANKVKVQVTCQLTNKIPLIVITLNMFLPC